MNYQMDAFKVKKFERKEREDVNSCGELLNKFFLDIQTDFYESPFPGSASASLFRSRI
jgi:hypothetical protein